MKLLNNTELVVSVAQPYNTLSSQQRLPQTALEISSALIL